MPPRPTDLTLFDNINPLSELPEQVHESLEQFVSYSEESYFPRVCLPLKEELERHWQEGNLDLYTMFVYFLMLGSKRTRLKVANDFRKHGTPEIPGDTKSEKNRALLAQAGMNPLVSHPVYMDVCRFARLFHWQERAEAWDTYIAKKTLTRVGNIISEVGMEAIGVLRNEMLSSKNGYIRINSAKALLDKAVPTITQSKTTNVDIKIDLSSNDEQLLAILGQDAVKPLEDRANFLRSLPEPPTLRRITADGEILEGEFVSPELNYIENDIPLQPVENVGVVPNVSQEEIDLLAKNLLNDFPDIPINYEGHS